MPLTDGKKQIGVATSLEKNIETDCNELINSLEKFASLALIDSIWKEHLRDMDDLKQSVQNAYLEQKDPLLIYKFESFELFKIFMSKVNEDIVSFLTSYTTGDFNDSGTTIKNFAIHDQSTPVSATKLLTHGQIAAFNKTATDTLKFFINHEMRRVV